MGMFLAYAGEIGSVAPHNTPVTVTNEDHQQSASGAVSPANMERFAISLSSELTDELDGAAEYLLVDVEAILVAALARAMERVLGAGQAYVDITVANERAGSWLAAVQRVQLHCVSAAELDATDMLAAVGQAMAAADADLTGDCDVLFSYGTTPIGDDHPGAAHAVELRGYRRDGVLQLDWWFDALRVDSYTVEELAEQFPLALIELSTEATPASR